MLNPLEYLKRIDHCIAQHRSPAGTIDVARVADAILVALPLVDRQGIDRELLCLIVKVRSALTHEDSDPASAAA